MTEDMNSTEADLLAKRLRLLLDVKATETGTEPAYSQIAAFLKDRGINLSRSRWTYMVGGHRYVSDRALLRVSPIISISTLTFSLGTATFLSPKRSAPSSTLFAPCVQPK